MNRYIIIHRLRWPALLLLTGVIALLDQADILSWARAWPLYLILLGVLALAERATLSNEPPPGAYPPNAYPYGYAAPGYPEGYAGAPVPPVPPPPTPGTSIVAAHEGETAIDASAREPRKSWEEGR